MHFWSCDITKHEICKIGHISAISKDRDFWFEQKKFYKFMCRTFHYFWGHQVHFWSRDWVLTIFLTESANIFETVPVRHIVTIVHREEHACNLAFGTMTFYLG